MDLTLHRDDASNRKAEEERADRALALANGVLIVAAPRSLVTGSHLGFRDHVWRQLNCKPVGIVIDCARLEYIDSSGVALLFSLAKEAKRRSVGYRVARPDEYLRYLLSLTRIDSVIAIADGLHTAIVEASLHVEATDADVDGRPRLRLEP